VRHASAALSLLPLAALALAGCDDPPAATSDAGRVSDAPAVDVAPSSCEGAITPRTGTTSELVDGSDRATVTIDDHAACARTYLLRSTAALRDNQPGNPRTVRERDAWPTLRSGHDLFDALYALAVDEMRENSVPAIRDGAFNRGGEVPCPAEGCFETGRLWNYVWTRDTAYAVNLGLAAMDPLRARNSLLFKLSARRDGADPRSSRTPGPAAATPYRATAWSGPSAPRRRPQAPRRRRPRELPRARPTPRW
jgi:hypothetical protein